MKYQFAFESFKGRRQENQDAYINYQIAQETFLCGIADGMGGVAGGREASQLAVDSILDYVKSLNVHDIENIGLKKVLKHANEVANYSITKAIEVDKELEGMGTTLCLLLIHKDQYAWSNIGDSRIFLIDEETIHQITEDHSYINEHYGKQGKEVPIHIKSQYENYLTRCIDGSGEKADIFPLDSDFQSLEEDTTFLLCSDGLILDKIKSDHSYLKMMVKTEEYIKDTVSNLISFAYSSGSKDNITVGLAKIFSDEHKLIESSKNKAATIKKQNRIILYTILALTVVASITILFVSGVFQTNKKIEVDPSDNSHLGISVDVDLTNWEPLLQEDYDAPLELNYHLYWEEFPKTDLLKEYKITIKQGDRVIKERFLGKTVNHVPLKSFILDFEVDYSLTIDAVLVNGTLMPGNTVNFKVVE